MNNRCLFIGCVLLGGLLVLTSGTLATASELIYQPINPAFGGNPSNAPMLLNEANAQNNFTAPPKDPLQAFTDNLNRELLARLATSMVDKAFGTSNSISGLGGLQASDTPYNIGNYSILVSNETDGSGFIVNITDKTTNNQTIIHVPYQQP